MASVAAIRCRLDALNEQVKARKAAIDSLPWWVREPLPDCDEGATLPWWIHGSEPPSYEDRIDQAGGIVPNISVRKL